MAIREHPEIGTILRCHFDSAFKIPEMQKKRLVVVISPKITARSGLCTIVPLSTAPPPKVRPYHLQLDICPRLPANYQSEGVWVKGDMVYAVSFERLHFVYDGKRGHGKRHYQKYHLQEAQLKEVRRCVLHGLGMSILTKHL